MGYHTVGEREAVHGDVCVLHSSISCCGIVGGLHESHGIIHASHAMRITHTHAQLPGR